MPRSRRPAAVAARPRRGRAARRLRGPAAAKPAASSASPVVHQELRHHGDLRDRAEARREHQVDLDRDPARPRARRPDRRHRVPGRPGSGQVGRASREAPLDLRLHAERGGAARPRTRPGLLRMGVGVLGRPGGHPRGAGGLGVGTYVQPAACRTHGRARQARPSPTSSTRSSQVATIFRVSPAEAARPAEGRARIA